MVFQGPQRRTFSVAARQMKRLLTASIRQAADPRPAGGGLEQLTGRRRSDLADARVAATWARPRADQRVRPCSFCSRCGPQSWVGPAWGNTAEPASPPRRDRNGCLKSTLARWSRLKSSEAVVQTPVLPARSFLGRRLAERARGHRLRLLQPGGSRRPKLTNWWNANAAFRAGPRPAHPPSSIALATEDRPKLASICPSPLAIEGLTFSHIQGSARGRLPGGVC